MSSKSQVKEIIDAYIHRNGNQEITGNILNRVLVAMLDAGVIDIIQDGAILPKDEDGNVVIPDFSMDGAVRYDIEQTLTEIEKELARRNIGAVDANFVGREVQDVYSALAGMITSEKNRAIGVENGLRSDLTAEIQRASTEELRIAGLVGTLYTNAQIDAFLAPKMERVELAMFASQTPLKITYKGQTTALTFEQIKTLVQNTAKFVTLLVDEAYYLIPSLEYYDDAVQFVGTNILTGQAEAVRVMINSSNFVSCYAIELEDSGHKVSSMENILPYDQYIKYPNVKAVIDYVSAHGGGLTPEQEQKLNDAITARDAEGSGVPALPFATKAEVGNLADLQTTDKSNIVNAINEVAQGGGSDWELIAEITTTEEVTNINITQDKDGNAFRLREMQVVCEVVPTSSNTSEDSLRIRTNVNSAAKGGQFSPFARMFRSSGITQPAVSQMAINGGYRCATNYGVTYVNPADSTILSADKVEDYSAVFLQATSGVCKFGIGSTIKVYGKRI